jgi:16S rRNA (adenine(1408)-N(1))-methyltransferase
MESIRGKQSREIGADEIATLARAYAEVLVDLGTGDGRFVRHMATICPDRFAIGVDACRENLQAISRAAPSNALYIIANLLELEPDPSLRRVAHTVIVNFPWGSLLRGLLDSEPSLMRVITSLAAPEAILEVRLNAGALAEEGWTLEAGANRIAATIRDAGFSRPFVAGIDRRALRSLPSTWGKRLAFGRDPRGLCLRAMLYCTNHRRVAGARQCRAPPSRSSDIAIRWSVMPAGTSPR